MIDPAPSINPFGIPKGDTIPYGIPKGIVSPFGIPKGDTIPYGLNIPAGLLMILLGIFFIYREIKRD